MRGYHAAIFVFIMDITNLKITATQYLFITSIFNVVKWARGTLEETYVTFLVYSRAFLFSGWFFGPALIVLYLIKIKKLKTTIEI